MNVFFSISEVANLLEVTERAIQKACKAGKYQTRQVPAKGGKGGLKYEIALSSLPKFAQDKYYQGQAQAVLRQAQDEREDDGLSASVHPTAESKRMSLDVEDKEKRRRERKEAGLKAFAKLPKAKKDHAKAKQRLVMACYQFIRDNSMKKVAGIVAFCEAVNMSVADKTSNPNQGLDSSFQLHPALRAVIPVRHGVAQLNPDSFKRWLYDYEEHGVIALVDDYGKRAGQSVIERNEELKRYVLGFMLRYPLANAGKVKQAIAAEKPLLDIVSERSIDRYMESWKAHNAQLWLYVTHPDKWKSVYMPAYGSHTDTIVRLNQLWEMDSTPGDWLLTDGRHSVVGVVDLYSRRLSFHVSKTSSAQAVCLAFRKAVLAWGVPETVRTDNGKDYTSERIDTVLRDLEIVQELCVPFASEEKGTIERHLGTMLHGLLELLPGFSGHNVAEAQRIRAMKSFAQRIMTPDEVVEVAMSAHDLQQALDRWATVIYAQSPHSGLNKRTPNQQAALYGGSIRRIDDERVLDMLLAEIAGTRTINKKGIRFEGRDYVSSALSIHTGKEAVLKYDDADMGKLFVYVEGEFIGVAECADLLGISRAEVATVSKQAVKKELSRQAKALKQYKKEVAKDIVDLVIEHRIENSDNVEFFPRPAKEHSTPALQQAAIAAGVSVATHSVSPVTVTTEDRAKVLEFLTMEKEVNVLEMNDAERFRYWKRLHARQETGGVLSSKELGFYESFQRTDTFRLCQRVETDLAIKRG